MRFNLSSSRELKEQVLYSFAFVDLLSQLKHLHMYIYFCLNLIVVLVFVYNMSFNYKHEVDSSIGR